MKNFLRTAFLASAVSLNLLLGMNPAKADALNGPSYHRDMVYGRAMDSYVIAFNAQEQAVVVVRGDHDSDLDLYVYDQNGNLITSDTDATDNCVVRFVPRWTGNFLIRVVNRGSVANRYEIIVR